MSDQLISSRQGQTLVLTISNPALRNALSPAMSAAAIEALGVAESNPEIRSVVITGDGAHFCAGGNLNRLLGNRLLPKDVQAKSIDALHGWIEAIDAFPKPVIAAVEGAAAGAGFSLALACDLMVAAQNAVFVMAYTSVGLSPDGGGSWQLAKAMPKQMAAKLMMLGERIDAAQMLQLGLLANTTPAGGALVGALALAEQLNQRAPNAVASVKDLIRGATLQPLHVHLDQEKQHFIENLHHANGGIGIESFLNKTKPRYVG
jgi:enoyl-CoA hydratase/carnithine racemase